MTSSHAQLDDLLGPDSPVGIPWARLVMVSTLHGSATLNATSGELGNDLDSQLLMGLRDWTDVVLVGSATVKAENYGGTPVRSTRTTPAPIAVLSSSLDLDATSAFFSEAVTPPIIACPSAALSAPDKSEARRALEDAGATLLDCGDGSITQVLKSLRAEGYRKVSCEGGPSVYSAMIEAQLFNQLYLTLDPHISPTVERSLVPTTSGSGSTPAMRLTLEHCGVSADSTVFLRYGTQPAP